jgi:hypothetical protein
MSTAPTSVPSASVPERAEVVVVGAGLAGLACARRLLEEGVDVHVVEAGDGVGGRVRTDEVEGFRLDRGFQVLLTAYDEVQAQVPLESLDLRAFAPGSLIWTGRKLERLADPWRTPGAALASAAARVGTFGDKLKVAALRRRVLSLSDHDCLAGPDRTTLAELQSLGFTPGFIDGFFRPFLGGVFLERELDTSDRLFRYYFRCFSRGAAAVPARGMQALPEVMAAGLEGRISLRSPVRSVTPGSVTLEGGVQVGSGRVVVAADGISAAALTGEIPPQTKATVTAYFSAPVPPVKGPLLVLDGEGRGPVNHLAVLTNVAPDYGPPGRHLVSASGVGPAASDPDDFPDAALAQLRRWFGKSVEGWEHLRTYHIPHALPRHPGGRFDPEPGYRIRHDGVTVAGDHTAFGAIQGALRAGRRAAEAVLSGE